MVFSDRVSWDEQEGRKCWNVQFTLAEYKSVPERAEAREKAMPASAGQNNGAAVAAASGDAGMEELGGFWAWLKGRDNFIGAYDSSSDSETADPK